MAAYNFMKRFAPLVESGEKQQTIRAERKDGRRPHVGETLYLYTGMRTKKCQKLLKTTCTSVDDIMILKSSILILPNWLNADEMDGLARADGFENAEQFFDFFQKEHGLPFRGLLIKWEPIP